MRALDDHVQNAMGEIQAFPSPPAPAPPSEPGAYATIPRWHADDPQEQQTTIMEEAKENDLSHSTYNETSHRNDEGLATARPVLSEHFDVEDMQKAQELDELSHCKTIDETIGRPPWLPYAVAAGVVLVVLAAVLSIVLQKDDPTPVPTASPSWAPSGEPSMAPSSALDDLFLQLPQYTLESLQDFETPQARAWNWPTTRDWQSCLSGRRPNSLPW